MGSSETDCLRQKPSCRPVCKFFAWNTDSSPFPSATNRCFRLLRIWFSGETTHTLKTGSSIGQNSPVAQTTNEEKKLAAEANPTAPEHTGGAGGLTGVNGAYGVIVTDVIAGGPAQEAGLKIGDTIIAIDDKSVKTIQMMEAAVSPHAAGSKIRVSYIRNGVSAETTLRR